MHSIDCRDCHSALERGRMIDKPNGGPTCSRRNEASFDRLDPSTLTLGIPDVQEIAMAIWQRQRDTLAPDTIAHNVKWRDQSIPSRSWDEFLLNAQAVV